MAYKVFYQGLVIDGKKYSLGDVVPTTIKPSTLQAFLKTKYIVTDAEYKVFEAEQLASLEPEATKGKSKDK